MTKRFKQVAIAALAISLSAVSVDSAYAQNAGAVKSLYSSVENTYSDLQDISESLSNFSVEAEGSPKAKRQQLVDAEAELNAIEEQIDTLASRYGGQKSLIHNAVLANNRGGALNAAEPGSADKVRDGSFWIKYDTLIKDVQDSLKAQRKKLQSAFDALKGQI